MLAAVAPWLKAAPLPTPLAGAPGRVVRVWQTDDGLPQSTVTAIVQTRDGYLWIGTYGGLARFDGVRFQKFGPNTTPGLADGRISSLCEDAHGVLWIGHDTGRVTRFHRGRFEPVQSRSSHAAERVAGLGVDTAGEVWALRSGGRLQSLTGGSELPNPLRQVPTQMLSLVRGQGGVLHLVSDGEVYRMAGAALERLEFAPARRTGFAMGIGAARQDGVWVVRDWRVQRWDGRRLLEDRGEPPWNGDSSLSLLLEMRNGVLAVGTLDQGLFLLSPDRSYVHLDRSNGLPQNWVRSLCEDREGNLWVGAGSGGLVGLSSVPFAVLNAPDQWQGQAALAVAASPSGALWIGTEGAGLYRHKAGSWARFAADEGISQTFVWAVAEDPDGIVFVGTWGGGIFSGDGDGGFAARSEFDPAQGPVFALQFEEKTHELWIGSRGGLACWPDVRVPGGVHFVVPGIPVGAVARDREGTLWFGSLQAGLGRLEAGGPRWFRRANGLSSDAVQCLLADADGTLWIGTADGGLNVLRSGVLLGSIGTDRGLPSAAICHIADDPSAHLWLSTHHGMVRVAKSEAIACAEGRTGRIEAQVFTREDGLPTIEFSGGMHGSGCRSPDGRLWFAGSKGVVSVDPANLALNPIEPPVVIESLQVDGRSISLEPGAQEPIRLRPEHQRLELEFTALSLSASAKVAFRYKMEGLDDAWVEAGGRRSVTYNHLPAGRYVFRVIARNNDGVWNQRGATFSFIVLPFFWETWWFLGLAVSVGLAGVVFGVRLIVQRRLRRRLGELERRHALERERARIARDIHDDVGASLTRISMLSQCASRDAQAADALEHIYGTAREMTRALDEIVWAVDPRHDSLDSLVGYMGKFAQDFLSASGLRCRLDVPVAVPDWPLTAEVRHNLFLAFKEALNNAVRHAAASEVRVVLTLNPAGFVLGVEDNGRGLPPGALATSAADRFAAGYGLENMRRRLGALGGQCTVEDRPDGGARVTFTVPAGSTSRAAPGTHTRSPRGSAHAP